MQTRRPAGRAAKGRAQASWQASEERDEEPSGAADEHEYEDTEGGAGGPASEDGADDSAFKVSMLTLNYVLLQLTSKA
jgi:hypothetical protein